MNLCALVVSLAGLTLGADPAAENPLLGELLQQGITVGEGQVAPLPPPVMADGLDAAAQRSVIAGIVGEFALDPFLRNSPVASHKLILESLKDASGNRVGQRADLYFVAYGKLSTLTGQGLLSEIAGVGGQSDPVGSENPDAHIGHQLTPQELAERGIATPQENESYGYFEVPVLERLRLGGVARAMTTHNDHWLVAAARLDPRFADDPKYANRWRPITRNDLGEPVVGDPQPYSGLGGYIKVTPLVEPAGALFVEVHGILNEPTGWFGGQNYLGSKLPLAVSDNVRTFRRKLLKAEEGAK